MTFAKITDAQRAAFDRDGFLVVGAALSEGELHVLEEAADGLIRQHGPRGGAGLEKHPTQVQLRMPIAEAPALLGLVGKGSVVSLCAQLLSPNLHLHTAAVLFKYPHACTREDGDEQAEFEAHSTGWHRDIGITEDMGHDCVFRAGIKVCYALSDFQSPRSGLTRFAQGSHLITSPLPVDMASYPAEHTPVQPPLRRGDAVLFENRIFHCGSVNMSPHVAKSLMIGYAYRWLGGHRKNMELVWPNQSEVHLQSRVTQQLLGGEGDGLIDWCRDNGFVKGQRGDAFRWVVREAPSKL